MVPTTPERSSGQPDTGHFETSWELAEATEPDDQPPSDELPSPSEDDAIPPDDTPDRRPADQFPTAWVLPDE